MSRDRKLMKSVQEELRLSREVHMDLRQFIRDERVLMRKQSEELSARLDRRLDRHDARLDRDDAIAREHHERQMRAYDDMSDEIKASTAATWAMVDRLNNGPATA